MISDAAPAATTAAPAAGSRRPEHRRRRRHGSPPLVSGVAGPPTPSVIAAGGRVTVAWHATSASAVRAFAAMSTDDGVTFGPPQQIDPDGAGNQIAPRPRRDGRRAGSTSRISGIHAGNGIVSATSASAAPPLPGATTEAWGNPVVVQAGATRERHARIGAARRRDSASRPPTMLSPLPATVVAFTDTQGSGGSQDVHVVGLLHGTTAPVIASPDRDRLEEHVDHRARRRERRRRRSAHVVDRARSRRRPARASPRPIRRAASSPSTPRTSSVTDTFEAVANDGVPGTRRGR